MSALAGRVVTPQGTLERGWVDIDGGHIAAVGSSATPPGAIDLGADATIVPGFVDIHVHGGGGFDLTSGAPDQIDGAIRFHGTHGTTTTLASMVTAPLDELIAAMSSIADWFRAAGPGERRRLAGIHLEGPFLATARCGAQNPAHMIDPEPDAVDALIAAGAGHLRVVTIAPERQGAIEAITRFVAAGVTVAVGHTDANTAETEAAIAAGARLATHLGNAMPPFHHREPGPIGACLASPDVACELIVDGHHLHPMTVRLAARAKDPDRLVLITDAIAAAGSADGRYRLGGLDVEVAGGVARVAVGDAHAGSLAGSTLTMDAAVRNACECGWSFGLASVAASLTPAQVLGLDGEIGSIEAGKWADLVVLDGDRTVRAVLAGGEVVSGSLT